MVEAITEQQHNIEIAAKLQKLIGTQEMQNALIDMANEEAKRKTNPSYKMDTERQTANFNKIDAVIKANFEGKDQDKAREYVNNGITISVSAKVAVEAVTKDKDLIKEVTAVLVEEIKNPQDAEVKKKADAARTKLYDKAVALLPEDMKRYPNVFDVVKANTQALSQELAADAVAGTAQTINISPELNAKILKFMNSDEVNGLVYQITQPYVHNKLEGTPIDETAVAKAKGELSAKMQKEFKPEEMAIALGQVNTSLQMTLQGSIAYSNVLKQKDLIFDAVKTAFEAKIEPNDESKKKAADARNLLIEKGKEVLPENLKDNPLIIEGLGREIDGIIKQNVDDNLQRLQIPQTQKGVSVDPLKMKPGISKGVDVPDFA